MQVIAADVGGTKTLVALYELHEGRSTELRRARYQSASYPGLEEILQDFLGESAPPKSAAIGVAGPVVEGRCQATNLPWELSSEGLEASSGISDITLINDFYAVALGLGVLTDHQLCSLSDPRTARAPLAHAPSAVIGAGTGLGEAICVPQPSDSGEASKRLPTILATEGGHTDFAPQDKLEDDLLSFLRQRHGHVSYERILSGPGLESLYLFLLQSGRASTEQAEALLSSPDPAAAIGEAALSGTCPAARMCVERFVSIYGAEAGNMALKTLPGGGLFIAGGIAPKLLPFMQKGTFMKAFLDKGRMKGVLSELPVQIIVDPEVGLLGALRLAVAQA